eukprot:TRINITY_DN17839_c0_g1_i1.p1 TRINITY_DN17839_c0_g1~~TRINITY_DN17839_c0_g1_i1.p1  ORF type:complete len:141 (-),score=10.19 TRINITY_DN17839_c0_g1_i1:52-474(-)
MELSTFSLNLMRSASSLRNLDLTFFNCPLLSEDTIATIYETISQLTDLTRLRLAFGFCEYLTKVNLSLDKSANSLKNLSLFLYSCPNIEEQSICHLLNTLRQLTQTTSISLSFKNCSIPESIAEDLSMFCSARSGWELKL